MCHGFITTAVGGDLDYTQFKGNTGRVNSDLKRLIQQFPISISGLYQFLKAIKIFFLNLEIGVSKVVKLGLNFQASLSAGIINMCCHAQLKGNS